MDVDWSEILDLVSVKIEDLQPEEARDALLMLVAEISSMTDPIDQKDWNEE